MSAVGSSAEEKTGLGWMLSLLPGTSVAESVRRLYELYRDFGAELERFAATTAVGCPAGCGRCCEVTDPEVTRAEAEFLAVYLVFTGRSPEGLAEPFAGGCIFYDVRNPLHCTVYEARPFLCRSFAFASVRDKHGVTRFRFCKEMPTGLPRTLTGAELDRVFPVPPPSMTDAGAQLGTLGGDDRQPLSVALPRALARVWLLKRLSEGGEDPDDTNPGGRPDDDGRPPEAGPGGDRRAA